MIHEKFFQLAIVKDYVLFFYLPLTSVLFPKKA